MPLQRKLKAHKKAKKVVELNLQHGLEIRTVGHPAAIDLTVRDLLSGLRILAFCQCSSI